MGQDEPLTRFVQKVAHKATEVASTATYKINQLRHLRKLPELSPLGARIVKEVQQEGVWVVSLEQLAFDSNGAFLDTVTKALEDPNAFSRESIEYDSAFEHCIPINPSKIAKHYPELYLWGLDEGLLDIVENCIGLPIAYHGVIVRKEIVDSRKIHTRLWHKDGEDRNIIRVSIYLNDVLDSKSGPFEYVPRKRSPSYRAFKGLESISNEDMERVVPACEWRACTGPAGTVIFGAVAKVFHHGRLPEKERVAASYYYTSRNPTNEQLCLAYGFGKHVSLIDAALTRRQRECLWKYQEYLPGKTN